MTQENIKIIKGMIRLFGREASINKIQEEAQELGLALNHLNSPTKTDKKKRLDDVYGELADMKIELRKAEMLFSKKKINRIVNQKLQKKKLKYLTKPEPQNKKGTPTPLPSKHKNKSI